jgi:DNA end-binding protein Ku
MALRMVSPDGTPLRRQYFTTRDDKPVDSDELVRGFEIGDDRFILIDDDELRKLAPDRSRDIDLRLFVKASDLDPMHFARAWYLTPDGDSTKAYRLLARAMESTGRAGIATLVMRGSGYLVAITAEHGILRAGTLRYLDELRTASEIGLPAPVAPSPAEVRRFEQRIEAMKAIRLEMDELKSPETERMLALARRKKKAGKDVRRPRGTAEKTGVIDLMERLQRSLEGG